MAFGNDERMTRRDRISIIESYAGSRFADNLDFTRQTTERTLFSLLARQLIEVVVLIQFVVLVCNEAFIWQLNVALICVLLVDGMKSETFFSQVSANSKICRSIGGKQIGDIH